jgi:hypothetical protein
METSPGRDPRIRISVFSSTTAEKPCFIMLKDAGT